MHSPQPVPNEPVLTHSLFSREVEITVPTLWVRKARFRERKVLPQVGTGTGSEWARAHLLWCPSRISGLSSPVVQQRYVRQRGFSGSPSAPGSAARSPGWGWVPTGVGNQRAICCCPGAPVQELLTQCLKTDGQASRPYPGGLAPTLFTPLHASLEWKFSFLVSLLLSSLFTFFAILGI